MTARLTMAFVAMLAISVVIDGCGDSSDSGSTGSAATGSETITTSSLSKAQFIKQGNVVCEKAHHPDKFEAAFRGFRSKGLSEREAAIEALKVAIVPITEAQIAAIRKMGAPAGDEEAIETALDAQQQAVDKFKTVEPAEAGENPLEYFAGATKQLEGYGLNACVFGL